MLLRARIEVRPIRVLMMVLAAKKVVLMEEKVKRKLNLTVLPALVIEFSNFNTIEAPQLSGIELLSG